MANIKIKIDDGVYRTITISDEDAATVLDGFEQRLRAVEEKLGQVIFEDVVITEE